VSIKISIIIPIRSKKVDDNCYRLEYLLSVIPANYEIIVVDDGSSIEARKKIQQISVLRARYVYIRSSWKSFSLSRARNHGAKIATGNVVIFHDVDFLAPGSVYLDLYDLIIKRNLLNDPSRFFTVPVVFLTEFGTEQYKKDFFNCDKEDSIRFRNVKRESSKYIEFFVEGSSCIVVNRAHLLSIGGHDESYKGHGAEDFELLHRLGEEFPHFEKPRDYEKNFGSGNVNEYRGFRAYFANFGKVCSELDIVLVHQWHPKRKVFGYYKHKRNFNKLYKLMSK
jgi:predicted glycosyltransferase involved in capsule biosynthesis